MPVMKNYRHERWIQGLAAGLEGGEAWTAAGFKSTGAAASASSSRRYKNDPKARARLIELQERSAKKITDVPELRQISDIRDLARQYTEEAVETLKDVMRDKKAVGAARVAAATALLDRGHGKAVQHIEAEISVYDSLDLPQKQALLEIIDEIIDADIGEGENEDAPGGPEQTHH